MEEGGAVRADTWWADSCFDDTNKENSNYYMPNNYYPNNIIPDEDGGAHALLLIGWDDNYSRNNFKKNPGIDGAWLVQNSWGKEWGNKGRFWMSYAQPIFDGSVFIAADEGMNIIHANDTLAAVNTIPYRWSAGIFRTEDKETLNEAAFYTRDNQVQYLEEGEYFSVIVKLSMRNDYPFVTAAAPVHYSDGNNFTAAGITEAGKSYFAKNDSITSPKDWEDGQRLRWMEGNNFKGGSFNACVRAISSQSSAAKISTIRLPEGTAGQLYSCSIAVSGARPLVWNVTGLPDTLRLNEGQITGTPSEAQTYNVEVTVSNSLVCSIADSLQEKTAVR